MTPKQLADLLKAKRSEAHAMLDALDIKDAEGKVVGAKEFTAEERTKYDAIKASIASLAARKADLEAIGQDDPEEEGDDGEEEAPEGAEEGAEEGELVLTGRSARAPAMTRTGRRSAPMRPGQAPAIHTKRSRRPYSILRAIRSVIDGRQLDGIEREVSDELAKRAIRTGRPLTGQFHVPLGLDPEMRALAYPAYARRDLTTSTGTGAIFTVPELPFIELLRSRLVLRKLGVTVLDDLQGLIGIPRQTGAATVNWVGEGSSATPSNQTLDEVPFSPHTAIALTNISMMFTLQTSVSAESFVKNDLAKQMAIAWDTVGFNGAGGAQPTGLFINSGVVSHSTSLAIGTNGGNPTFAKIVAMESLIATGNADLAKLAYVTSPALRGYMKTLPKLGTTFPEFVFTGAPLGSAEPGAGEINGYPAYATTVIPTNLTKGSSGATLTQIAFGNWEDLICGIWDDALSFLVNPYTNQASGGVVISTSMAVDFNVRHPESFAIITDAASV